MKATEGRIGRVFVIRLEDGDKIPGAIEQFAAEKGISAGHVTILGGVGSGQVTTGPRYTDRMPPDPLLLPVDGAHDVLGVGLLAPGEDGKSVLHIHAAMGRAGQTLTGCLQAGVETWLVGEVVLYEITGIDAVRILDARSGFALLECGREP